jgi:hypothetical protein
MAVTKLDVALNKVRKLEAHRVWLMSAMTGAQRELEDGKYVNAYLTLQRGLERIAKEIE